MATSKKFIPSIRFTVFTAFTIATTLTAAFAISLQFYFGQLLAQEAAKDLYSVSSHAVADKIRSIRENSVNVIELLAENPALINQKKSAKKIDSQLRMFARVMENNPFHYGIYLGYDDGSFFEVINLNASNQARRALRALPTDRWMLIHIGDTPDGRTRNYHYYDEQFNLRIVRTEATKYDVRTRPWYIGAQQHQGVFHTGPYLFSQLGQSGQTISKRLGNTGTVLAMDITSHSLSSFLASQAIAEYSDIFLYNQTGEIIASSNVTTADTSHYSDKFLNTGKHLPIPSLKLSATEKQLIAAQAELKVSNEMDWPPFDYTISGRPNGYSVDIIRMIAGMTGLKIRFVNGLSWSQLTAQFNAGEIDILQSLLSEGAHTNNELISDAYASLPYALATRTTTNNILKLSELNGKKIAIPAGWSIIPTIQQSFPAIQIVETDNTRAALQSVLDGEAYAALDNKIILEYVAAHHFLEGLSYHSNLNFGDANIPDTLRIKLPAGSEQLMAIFNKAIAAIGKPQRDYLAQQWLEPDTNTNNTGFVPSKTLIDLTSQPNLQNQLLNIGGEEQTYFVYGSPLSTEISGELFFGVKVPESAIIDPFMDRVKLSIVVTAIFLLILLPLSLAFARPIVRSIKQLALENDKIRDRNYDDVQQVVSNIKELDELSESMVEMVDSIKAHELAQRELMDAFIQLIAEAIDDKSPYTGGHCERVPKLALLLANKACSSQQAPFDQFTLSKDQWREFRIAAWLHDCGKITTPEHIVDKGSKLETIYNRIHEVRMRFEVLHRDVEIDYWKTLENSPELREQLSQELSTKQQQLQDDYQFIADCNVGGEYLDPEKQQRLQAIGQRIWLRYFDDQLGLSPVEEIRVNSEKKTLPAEENLLSDKAEHIIERTSTTDYPPEYGINMDIPEHLYNQGEIYNLSISRGTLTAEDRFKINEHMISTIKMLESLPFPEELTNVPRYASTHHETVRGDGYPRKLSGDQLSIPERILVVADIFEALTASDRPYKKAKPVSVAIDILHKMVLDQHVDKDCFELFIRSGAYKEYAAKHLTPEQNDEVDISQYLAEAN